MFFSGFNFKDIRSKVCQPFKKNNEYDNHRGYDGKTIERKFNREWGTVKIRRDPSFGYNPEKNNFMSFNSYGSDSSSSSSHRWEYYSSDKPFNSESMNEQEQDDAKWKDTTNEFYYFCFCPKGGGSKHRESIGCREKSV